MASAKTSATKPVVGPLSNPYSNLEDIFGPYVNYIEQKLNEESPEPPGPVFEETYTVKSFNEWDEKKSVEYEYGNRIIAPDSAFKSLLSKGAETPIILQIFNVHNPEYVSHCSVVEWTAPDGILYVPSWMFTDFALQNASKQAPQLTLRYYEKPFLKGSFIQIQPFKLASVESEEFKDVQKLFEVSLKKYQCLTIGDILRIKHNENVHKFEVTDVISAQSIASHTPFNVVSIVNTDVAVDFLPPKDAPITDEKEREYQYVEADPKSIPNPDDIISTTVSSDQKVDDKQIENYKTTANQLDSNVAKKKKDVETFLNVVPQKIVCDEGQKTTRIQIVLIGNKKEVVKVNLTTTVKQLYAHAKLVSGCAEAFQLLNVAANSKPLTDPAATVESEKLSASRLRQKAL
eukprot:212670_1